MQDAEGKHAIVNPFSHIYSTEDKLLLGRFVYVNIGEGVFEMMGMGVSEERVERRRRRRGFLGVNGGDGGGVFLGSNGRKGGRCDAGTLGTSGAAARRARGAGERRRVGKH